MTVSASIQIHFSPGDVSHRHRDTYTVLDIGYLTSTGASIHFVTLADVDEVIAELVALRAEMTAPADDEYQLTAKDEAALSVTAGPPFHVTGTLADPCKAEDNHYICNSQEGHDGPVHVAYGTGSEVCHTWPVDAEPAQDETPSAVLPHCAARWPNRGPAGGQWICTLDKGHDGDHEAGTRGDGRPFFSSVPQDDDEVTWDPSAVTA